MEQAGCDKFSGDVTVHKVLTTCGPLVDYMWVNDNGVTTRCSGGVCTRAAGGASGSARVEGLAGREILQAQVTRYGDSRSAFANAARTRSLSAHRSLPGRIMPPFAR
jgi:hypothetical protein